jgi:ornithine--oxo-acid transaminase
MMPIADVISTDAYSEHVNPLWVKLLSLLEKNVSYERCLGAVLFTTDGRRILDFLSGYCVHNTGHIPPAITCANLIHRRHIEN